MTDARKRISRPLVPALVYATLVLIAAVSGARAAAKHAAIEVESFGSLREIIHQGRIEGRALLATALSKPHAYGLGALARLDGEFVILDGKV